MTVTIHIGDCREVMRTLPAESVHTCISSPPYFGLRDYGVDGQIGLEAMPDCLGWATGERCGACFVCTLVDVYREVRRVLRDDGTCWVNLGDTYAGSGRGGNPTRDSSTLQGSNSSQEASQVKRSAKMVSAAQRENCPPVRGSRLPPGLHAAQFASGAIGRLWVPAPAGFKQKDLMGIPWRVAFALQADGWYLRQDIIWAKPNPMPESVTDRCTKSHEHLFLLSKSPTYHFDASAIAEPLAASSVARLTQPNIEQQAGSNRVPGKTNGNMKAVRRSGNIERKSGAERGCPEGTGSNQAASVPWEGNTRNKRDVWTVATKPYSEAHFATFPPALIEPCVLAGCPAGGTVLDHFGGSGTTGEVAESLGRNAILIELNPAYAQLADRRTQQGGISFPTEATS